MTTGPDGQKQLTGAALGMGYSVLFMLALVFGLMGIIAWRVALIAMRERKKEKLHEATAAAGRLDPARRV